MAMRRAATPTGYDAFARFYDACWGDDWAARVEEGLARILEHTTRGKHVRILDVACGGGHVAGRLQNHGHELVGIDASAALLRAARRRVPRGSFRRWRFGAPLPRIGAFDAAICVYDSLNHAPDHAIVAHTISTIAGALRPGGVFIFDYNSTKGFATRWDFAVHIDRPWGTLECTLKYDAQRKQGVVHATGVLRGRRFDEVYREIAFSPAQVRAWLTQAGLVEKKLPIRFLKLLPQEPGRVWVMAEKR